MTLDLDFYTVTTSKKTRRSLTLCEFCYEGEWTRFGRRVLEVVRRARQVVSRSLYTTEHNRLFGVADLAIGPCFVMHWASPFRWSSKVFLGLPSVSLFHRGITVLVLFVTRYMQFRSIIYDTLHSRSFNVRRC